LAVATATNGAPPATTGIITTIAGTGTAGVGGDGGPATAAQVNYPVDAAVDAAGNVYIADGNNHRIRKVTAATGAMSTVAGTGVAGFLGDGGPATAARLYYPQSVAVDGAGNVYIADRSNHRIRKLTVATGIITTVAGSGTGGFGGDGGIATAAQLYNPKSVDVDGAGNLYIADWYNHRVRMVTAATGIITTVAGSGTAGYNGDGPATGAHLNQPYGVSVDAAGNVYIADTYNHRLRKVTVATGLISTVAGTGPAGFLGEAGPATTARLYYPVGVTVDGAGNVYIADQSNHRIRKVAAATGVITTVAGSGEADFGGDGGVAPAAQLSYPQSVQVDSAGNLYIADQYNQRIRKVTAPTVPALLLTTVAGTGTYGYNGDGPATSANLSYPYGVAVDGAGNVYAADTYSHRIRKITAGTGVISTVAGSGVAGFAGEGGTATAARLYYPVGVAVDGAGNLYIADQSNQRVRKVTAATGIISTIAGNGTAGGTGDGGAATAAELYNPQSVAVDAAGNVYIADQNNHRIRKVTIATGVITTVAGTGTAGVGGDGGAATLAQLRYPEGIAVDGAGNLYIGDTANHRIRKVTAATGLISTFAGTGTAGFAGEAGLATAARLYYPRGLSVDGAGNLYIADQYNTRIRKVTVATNIITTVAGSGTSAFGGDGGVAPAGQLQLPLAVAVDSSGGLYIADTYNHRVRKAGMPLDPPVLTGMIASPTSIRLTWTAAAGAASYTVKRGSTSGGETVIATGVAGTSFVDAGLTNGLTYYYIVSAVGGGETADSNEISVALIRAVVPSDYDGDRRSDIAIYRPSNGGWYFLRSATNFTGGAGYVWGLSTDKPVVGDYDGDGKNDIAVFRPSSGHWFVLKSSTNFTTSDTYQWGTNGDIPVPADYDGDRKTDVAIYRPSTGRWYVLTSGTGYTSGFGYVWGVSTDVPVPGDYDGDGKADIAVYRTSSAHWFILTSNSNYATYLTYQWGSTGDIPVPGDYDGDGRLDMTIYRPSTGTWYILTSSSGFASGFGYAWGASGDVPVAGDYDGDGRTDIAVYRTSTGHWFILQSSTSFTTPATYQWGSTGDIPILRRE
jgi:hypothetical protein